jgi:hypothetical protein
MSRFFQKLGNPHDLGTFLKHTVATMETKAIVGTHCLNIGNRSLLAQSNDLKKIAKMTLDTIVAFDTIVIGKGKGVPLHAMEVRGGRGGVAPTHTHT